MKRLRGRRRRLVRPGPCAEWALRGLHPLFADLVRWGCFCITSFFILLRPPPPLSLSQSPSPSLFLSGHANCSQGQSVGCAPLNAPHPSPGFEWHVLIRPNLIGRRCLGWIGTALYSPLLLMCACVCVCVRVMHVRL